MNKITKSKKQAAQVYFDANIYIQIKEIAKKQNQPLAGWIREVVLKEINKHQKNKKNFTELPTFNWNIPDKELSNHIDEAIYDPT